MLDILALGINVAVIIFIMTAGPIILAIILAENYLSRVSEEYINSDIFEGLRNIWTDEYGQPVFFWTVIVILNSISVVTLGFTLGEGVSKVIGWIATVAIGNTSFTFGVLISAICLYTLHKTIPLLVTAHKFEDSIKNKEENEGN